jgi:hypothetical protein
MALDERVATLGRVAVEPEQRDHAVDVDEQ